MVHPMPHGYIASYKVCSPRRTSGDSAIVGRATETSGIAVSAVVLEVEVSKVTGWIVEVWRRQIWWRWVPWWPSLDEPTGH